MVKKKGKSHRLTIHQKNKIERRVKEHHRRLKKEANRNKAKGIGPRKAKPKDPGIPNSWPFKEDLLNQISKAREGMERRKAESKELRQKTRAEQLAKRRGLIPDSLDAMLGDAQSRANEFLQAEEDRAAADEQGLGLAAANSSATVGQQSRRAYLRELKKVVGSSDVVLEVLDARDPMGSRSSAVEAAVGGNAGKKLVLVLNKVDLVPKEVTAGWLAYLRRSYPTIAFKACTQERGAVGQARGVSSKAEAAEEDALQRSGAVGVDSLLGLLKNYCRSGASTKTSVTVGVVGYPNTGKSSLINSLKRSKAVGTSATAGFTKAMQEVQLDKHVRLLDCPGIVFDDTDTASTVLRNCVNPDDLADPQAAVQAVLGRCPAEQLMTVYALPRFNRGDADMFLGLVARKLGKVKKGGVPDKDAAARAVLRDWNNGKVPFYTAPPTDDQHLVGEASVVAALGDGFSVDSMMEHDSEVLGAVPAQDRFDFVAMDGSTALTPAPASLLDEDGEEDMAEAEEDEAEEDEAMLDSDEEGQVRAQALQVQRTSKSKKGARRAKKHGSGGGGGDYDFATDF